MRAASNHCVVLSWCWSYHSHTWGLCIQSCSCRWRCHCSGDTHRHDDTGYCRTHPPLSTQHSVTDILMTPSVTELLVTVSLTYWWHSVTDLLVTHSISDQLVTCSVTALLMTVSLTYWWQCHWPTDETVSMTFWWHNVSDPLVTTDYMVTTNGPDCQWVTSHLDGLQVSMTVTVRVTSTMGHIQSQVFECLN